MYCDYVFCILHFDSIQMAWVDQCIALYLQKAAYGRLGIIRKMETLFLLPVFGSSKKATIIDMANERQILRNYVNSGL